MDDRLLRRAGLDYHEWADVRRHASWPALERTFEAEGLVPRERRFAFSTRAQRRFDDVSFAAGDALVFGSETAGLATAVLDRFAPEQCLRLPMRRGQRSLNLSNAVAVAVFEAWRQLRYAGGA